VPWVRAILRGQKVYARATASGALAADNGRVEVRYKPNDGRRYEARADNLTIADPTPLPDETCSEAEAVAKSEGAAKPAARSTGRNGMSTKDAAIKAGVPKAPDGAVIVYADGACSGNPGPAGLGIVVVDGPRRVEISEYLGQQTNNIAELTAVLRALGEIEPSRATVIHTDSQYTIGVLQKGWKAKANTELVAELRTKLRTHKETRLVYVPGHSGVLLNERADALAREAVQARKSRREVFTSKSITPPGDATAAAITAAKPMAPSDVAKAAAAVAAAAPSKSP
jgi:ribonuclease HI